MVKDFAGTASARSSLRPECPALRQEQGCRGDEARDDVHDRADGERGHAQDGTGRTVTAVTADGGRSAQYEHTMAVTETGLDILTKRTANSRPFY